MGLILAALITSSAVGQQKPVLEIPAAKAGIRNGNAALHGGDLRHRGHLRHGADSRRQVPDGQPRDEEGRKQDEGPQVEVQVEPFWMGKHEVTWDEYEIWSFNLDIQRRSITRRQADGAGQAGRCRHAAHGPVHRYDLRHGQGGLSGHLHDATGGQEVLRVAHAPRPAATIACRPRPNGNTPAGRERRRRTPSATIRSKLGDYAWYFDNSDEAYHKVGLKKPNPWGLHDMHGNVAEYVLDRYDPDFYKTAGGRPAKNPVRSAQRVGEPGRARAARGTTTPKRCAARPAAARHADWKIQDPQIPQSLWYYTDALFCGFRVVRPLREPTAEEKAKFAPDKIQVYKEK